MKRSIPSRRSRIADWAKLSGGLALPELVLGVLGARLGLVPQEAILPVLMLGFLLAVAGLVLAIYALTDIWHSGADGARASVAGIVYAAPVLAVLALISAAALFYPRLTDISTDIDDPPTFAGSDAPRGALSAAASAIQRDAYPDIGTRIYEAPVGEVYAAARRLVEARGWTITDDAEPRILPPPAPVVAAAPPAPPPPLDEELQRVLAAKTILTQSRGEVGGKENTETEELPAEPAPPPDDVAGIEAVAPTPILGFQDDVVIRLLRSPEGTRVDLRSASRRGAHDLGQNARRIRKFLADLDAVLQPEASTGGAATATVR